MTTQADDIASTVLGAFSKLPAKRKPVVRDNGLREWVPLAGIVVKGKDYSMVYAQLRDVMLTLKLETRSGYSKMCSNGVSPTSSNHILPPPLHLPLHLTPTHPERA